MRQTANSRQHTEGNRSWCCGVRCLLSAVCCLLSVVCCVLASGCVTRSLTIKTEPPGALVYVNDELKGQSPVTYDFVWYGWHRVLIRKDGFQRVDDRKEVHAPVYLCIPFDLAMELLPFRIHDTRTWSYVLTPAPTLPTPVPPATEPGHPEPASQQAPPPSTTEPPHDSR